MILAQKGIHSFKTMRFMIGLELVTICKIYQNPNRLLKLPEVSCEINITLEKELLIRFCSLMIKNIQRRKSS